MSKKSKKPEKGKIVVLNYGDKRMVSMTLSLTARQMLDALAAKQGVSKTAIVEMAVRERYRAEFGNSEPG